MFLSKAVLALVAIGRSHHTSHLAGSRSSKCEAQYDWVEQSMKFQEFVVVSCSLTSSSERPE